MENRFFSFNHMILAALLALTAACESGDTKPSTVFDSGQNTDTDDDAPYLGSDSKGDSGTEVDTAFDTTADSETQTGVISDTQSLGDDDSAAETETAFDTSGGDANTVKVFILAGQSNMLGTGTVAPSQSHLDKNGGKGTLEYLVKSDSGKFGHLADKDGQWVSRADVWLVDFERSGPLTVTGDNFGPELQFGHVMGDHYESQVLIIKIAWGGKSLAVDFRPPSSGGEVGASYLEMMARIREVLGDLPSFMPSYEGQGYEIAGFGWHQGWNDRVTQEFNDEYQTNCVNLINDMRAELKVPQMPFALATTGMSGWEETHPRALSLMAAQLAVPDDPRLEAGKAYAVETRDFWRGESESPVDQGYHWNRNAETLFLIGAGLAQAMLDLINEQ